MITVKAIPASLPNIKLGSSDQIKPIRVAGPPTAKIVLPR